MEFENCDIERLQEEVASRNGFRFKRTVSSSMGSALAAVIDPYRCFWYSFF